jgi:hypothetical protein
MIVIYDVLYGPIWCEDIPDWDFDEDGEAFVLVCRVWDADENQLIDDEVLFETLDDALEVIDHFREQKKPFLIIDDEDEEEEPYH